MAKLPHFKSVQDNVTIRGFSQRVKGLANQIEVRAVISALCFDHLDPAGRRDHRHRQFSAEKSQYHRSPRPASEYQRRGREPSGPGE